MFHFTNQLNPLCYSYEALLLEEQAAAQEMAAFERKLDSWASIPRAEHLKVDAASAALGSMTGLAKPASSPSMPPAVIAFEVRRIKIHCVETEYSLIRDLLVMLSAPLG
jgi:hypothetical protein